MSVILTADSAEDFLDQVSSLDRVAADTQQTLDAALAAKTAAGQAQAEAAASQAAAEKAKADADAAAASAQQATADVTSRKSDLDAEAARYKSLYDSLSEQERQAAAAAAERANAAANAAAAAADPAQAAAAPVAANRSENRTPITDTSAPAESSSSEAAAPSAPSGSSAAAAAVAAALSREGMSYVYGAAGPSSFDCSGLTSWAWAQAGVSIPRTSGGQAGLPSVPLSELQPGDLVTYYSPVSHVGMYIGNGQIIHASSPARPIYITTVSGGGPSPSGHRVSG